MKRESKPILGRPTKKGYTLKKGLLLVLCCGGEGMILRLPKP